MRQLVKLQQASQTWQSTRYYTSTKAKQLLQEQLSHGQVVSQVVSFDLAQQLQQFGAAVCAALPAWSCCCNNPGCVQLQKCPRPVNSPWWEARRVCEVAALASPLGSVRLPLQMSRAIQ